MSPLLGSTGGSSEYAYRGTLDDWPNDFAASLSAQNLSAISPIDTVIATLTIAGINYKARVIVENANASLSVDGGVTYFLARETDPPILVRDNTTIRIRLQPTSGTKEDFSKTYFIPVKIGKRIGYWTVPTRDIDQTPISFTFTPLTNQELGIGVTSNTITIAELEQGFSFPISVTASDGSGDVGFFKNGIGPYTTETVQNGDRIYLASFTSTTYSTPRNFPVTVGNYTTSWGILTRNVDVNIEPFNFVGVSSANILGAGYTSNTIIINGADPGPTTQVPDPTRLPVTISGPNAFYEIRTAASGNPLRYTDPLNPLAPNYWQNQLNYAYNTDRIAVKINASSSYNTTVTGSLTVSGQTASYIVTTRPAPIDTIPSPFSFPDLTNQQRGVVVTSSPVTLSGMTNGATDFGTALIVSSITNAGAGIGITPQFNVNGSATWISPPTTAQVKNGDVIRLRMTTPNPPDKINSTSSILFRVTGSDTSFNLPSGDGFRTDSGLAEYTWSVSTVSRICPITPFTLQSATGITTNTTQTISFIPVGYDIDCNMTVSVTSNSTEYNFISRTPPGGPTSNILSKTLTNVVPGTSVTLQVRSSLDYLTKVTSTVTVTNSDVGNLTVPKPTPYSTDWIVETVPDRTDASFNFLTNTLTQEVNNPIILSWDTINCTSVRSVSWPTISGIATLSAKSGSAAIVPTTVVNPQVYTMSVYVNPFANNSGTFPSDGTGPYIEKTLNINVIDDSTPIFTPDTFTPVSNTSLSSPGNPLSSSSNRMVISSLSSGVSLTARIVPSPNVTASITVYPDSISTIPISGSSLVQQASVINGNAIQMTVLNADQYLTERVGIVSFTYTSTPPVLKDTKSFSVTTASCTPSSGNITQFTTPSPLTNAVIRYYTTDTVTGGSPRFTTGGSTLSGQTLLFGSSSTSLITSTGNFSSYYQGINGNTGGYLSGTVTAANTITWNAFIDIVWHSWITRTKRPPTQTEVNSMATLPVSGATTLANYATLIASQAQAAANLRNTAFPIYNSCPDTATGSIINNSLANGGSYPDTITFTTLSGTGTNVSITI